MKSKNQIKAIASAEGITARYSGKERTMYLQGAPMAVAHFISENKGAVGFEIKAHVEN